MKASGPLVLQRLPTLELLVHWLVFLRGLRKVLATGVLLWKETSCKVGVSYMVILPAVRLAKRECGRVSVAE